MPCFRDLGFPGSSLLSTTPAYWLQLSPCPPLFASSGCPSDWCTLLPPIAQKSPSSCLGVKLILSAVILIWISVLADALRDAAPDQSLRHRTLLLPILLSVWAFRIPATSFRGDDSLSGFCKLWPEVRTFIQTVGVTSSMNETILCFPFASYPIIMWAPGNTPVQMDCGLSGYLITIYTTSSDHPFTFS